MLTNIFRNIKSPYVQTVTDIPSVLNQIKTGFYKDQIIEARAYGKGHEVFEQIKTEMPTFSPNGCFIKKRTTNNIQHLSGFIYLDIDSHDDPELFHQLPFVYSCWKSFSGTGLGVLVSVSGLTTDNFNYSWKYLNDHFQKLNIEVDPHTKDLSRQCVISYDPEIYINPEPIPLRIPEPKLPTITVNNISPVKYTSTSTGQGRIKYNTTLDDYEGQDYIVIGDGKDFRNTYLPRKILSGERHKWLSSFTSTILFNNPDISLARLEREILRANTDHCIPTLSVEEVIPIVKWTFDKHIHHILNIQTKKKKIWLNPESRLSIKEKRKIIGQETGKLRKQKTIKELVDLYLKLQQTDQKITQKLFQTHSNRSILTIKKYWHEIKEKVYYVQKKEKKGYI